MREEELTGRHGGTESISVLRCERDGSCEDLQPSAVDAERQHTKFLSVSPCLPVNLQSY